MAASDAKPFPVKNKAFCIVFPILDNDGDLVTGASGLDSEVSKDLAGFADCTNEATEIGSSGVYYLDLTSTEMNADIVTIVVKTSTTDAKSTVLTVPTISIPEPSGVPAFGAGGAGVENVLGWLLAHFRNRRTQTATTTTLRNDANSADIATSAISDDGTTFAAAEWA